MKNQFKVIVDEIKKERDREIIEFLDKEICAVERMIKISALESSKYYWEGRKVQTLCIKEFIVNNNE